MSHANDMTYPVRPVKLPDDLQGQTNGKLDARLLVPINGGQLHHAAAASWKKMAAAAAKDGVTLEPTSYVDTYRPYEVQERIFRERYDRVPRNSDSKVWNGVRYWLRSGYAMAAVPGTSNHGWALAVDCDLRNDHALAWLTAHAVSYGWSWEAQSEPWHIRYVRGWEKPYTPPRYTRPLFAGCKGDDVRAVQRALNKKIGARLVVDGIFGNATGAAVKQYRKARPALWVAKPVVNQATWRSLMR